MCVNPTGVIDMRLTCIKQFFQGLILRHVDWSTRHNSRYYKAGVTRSKPFVIDITSA